MASKTEKAPLPSGPQMAAEELEKAGKPVHVKLIAQRVLKRDKTRKPKDRAYRGATPEQTISAALTTSHGKGGLFERVAPGVFALRAWPAATKRKAPELPNGAKVRKSPGGRKQRGGMDPQVAAHTTVLREARSPEEQRKHDAKQKAKAAAAA